MAYRYRHRKESFAHIVSMPNGWVDLIKLEVPLEDIRSGDANSLRHFRFPNMGALFANKRLVSNLYEICDIPQEVFDLDCPLSAPLVLYIELTRKCNLSCRFCYSNSGKSLPNEFSTEEMVDILREAKQMNIFSVFFSGGEPTLHSDFIALTNEAYNLGLDLFVTTNGTMINEKLLNEVPQRTHFVVSFDGINSHEKLHGGLNFAAMQRVWWLLKERGFRFTVQFVLQRENLEDMIATYQWFGEHHIDVGAIDLFPVGRARHHLTDISLTEDQISSIDRLAEAKFEYEKAQALWEQEYQETDSPNPYIFSFVGRLEEVFERNQSGVFCSCISPDGNVYPDNWCSGQGVFRAGNIREKSFREIWLSSFKEIRTLGRWKNFAVCRDCPVSAYFCDYRHPLFSKNLHGSFNQCGATEVQRQIMLRRIKLRLLGGDNTSADVARAFDIW